MSDRPSETASEWMPWESVNMGRGGSLNLSLHITWVRLQIKRNWVASNAINFALS